MTAEAREQQELLALVLLAEDDTEESVVGSDRHQEAIEEAHGPLAYFAAEQAAAGGPLWYVSTQVTVLVSLPHRARPWRPKPDLFVVPGVAARSRTSYDARVEGPMPPFVLEVASESTHENDVGEKAQLYGVVGVREYLVFDPAGEFLGQQVRGWRRQGEVWVPWMPVAGPGGVAMWPSDVLGLAVRPEGLRLRCDHPRLGPLPLLGELHARVRAAERAREEAERAWQAERQAREAAEAALREARARRDGPESAAGEQ